MIWCNGRLANGKSPVVQGEPCRALDWMQREVFNPQSIRELLYMKYYRTTGI